MRKFKTDCEQLVSNSAMRDAVVFNAIFERRSLRRYLPDDVPQEQIEQVLNAGIWAPSAHNRQPWRFAVITSAERKHALATSMGERLRHDLEADNVPEAIIAKDTQRSYERLTSAPVLIVLCVSMADMDTYTDAHRNQNEFIMAVQSTAMCGQNMLLAAHALGLGACWMCAPLFCPDVVQAALALPDAWQPQGIITMGFPAQERERTREPLETRVLWR
jgi:F420 biosynthesis protein FbiB-like protein